MREEVVLALTSLMSFLIFWSGKTTKKNIKQHEDSKYKRLIFHDNSNKYQNNKYWKTQIIIKKADNNS